MIHHGNLVVSYIPPDPQKVTVAAFMAPLVTPLLAIVQFPLIMPESLNAFDLVIAIPLATIVALFFGYIGMALVCLPVAAVLHWRKCLYALPLAWATGLMGALSMTVLFSSPDRVGDILWFPFFVSFVCGFGVSLLFGWLSDLKMRATRG